MATISQIKLPGETTTYDIAVSWTNVSNKPTIPDVSGKENTSNKVTSLSSSSTDTQYPSAKCVYTLIGNLESLLAAI